ncbi:hypothetical protein EYL81_002145, partial [Neisseria gonorrhoeae]
PLLSATFRHSRENGNLELLNFQTAFEYCRCPTFWIPALYDALYQRGALLFLTFPFDSQVKGAFLCQQQM